MSTETFDYRELLKKYINHVIAMEGIDYLREAFVSPDPTEEGFTEEEIKELKKISAEG